MKLLAIETSSIACSVALQLDDQIACRHVEQAREHTRLLVPMIEELMTEAGLGYSALDALVLGNGPGSFIGLRIAASVSQGIAFAADLPVIPVSSFEAMAEEVFCKHPADEVVVTADAHMNEVYLASFVRNSEGGVSTTIAECLHPLAPLVGISEKERTARYMAGAGWQRYPELLQKNQQLFSAHSGVAYPNARYLLPSASRQWRLGLSIAPADIEPAYLRQVVAQPKPAP